MDKQKTINSFTELTSTELNDIKGGGILEYLLEKINNSQKKPVNHAIKLDDKL